LICHRIEDHGPSLGPDLRSIGGKFDRPHLIESRLEPSRQFVEGFRATAIETDDGRLVTGFIHQESPERIVIADKDGKLITLSADQIVSRQMLASSPMPEDLWQGLSLDEFADLIAYLETLQGDRTQREARKNSRSSLILYGDPTARWITHNHRRAPPAETCVVLLVADQR